MARPLTLEDFGSFADLAPVRTIDGERLESEKLEAFDKGYAAGWDDATEAAERDALRSGQAVQSRLEDLTFTFHEARAHVMRALMPLMETIASTALPAILRASIGPRLVEMVESLAETAADAPIVILTSPDTRDEVEAALLDHARFPHQVRADPDMPEALIHVRMGEAGQELDLGAVETRLTEALAALDTINKETLAHG